MYRVISVRIFLFITLATLSLFQPCHAGTEVSPSEIIIDENLKLGMTVKDAFNLLGSPERLEISDRGTILIPYSGYGLLIEVESNGTIIEGLHLQASFSGSFQSGLYMGADFQEILNVYRQPDGMTKDTIEYRDIARIFRTHDGKLVGADIYLSKGSLYRRVVGSTPAQNKPGRVFALYGFKVEKSEKGIVVTYIQPASPAEYGGLRVGQSIDMIAITGGREGKIQSVAGLENLLREAIETGKKDIRFYQRNRHDIKVPKPGGSK